MLKTASEILFGNCFLDWGELDRFHVSLDIGQHVCLPLIYPELPETPLTFLRHFPLLPNDGVSGILFSRDNGK